jgi:hypothetical protein
VRVGLTAAFSGNSRHLANFCIFRNCCTASVKQLWINQPAMKGAAGTSFHCRNLAQPSRAHETVEELLSLVGVQALGQGFAANVLK